MKKKITRVLALMLAVALALSLAACGKKDSGTPEKPEPSRPVMPPIRAMPMARTTRFMGR